MCDEQIDSDYHGCHEDPQDKCGLICDDCNGEYSDREMAKLEAEAVK
ncbi:hypothetical protein LCGC14_0351720 [marine sediment metagenome]|uniref:Uncharacterized protein n=1 Tax=marine sediment metagenome TaxID=412755 RepID=A0A0F9WIR7_9ZZZZ